jgi:P2-related tail formation protein
MNEVLASAINKPHISVYDHMFKDAIGNMDLSPVLMYLVDTCHVKALPFLAEQFGVLGYKGWKFADTEQKQRALIKNAIRLNQKHGTPYAIRQAMKVIGFDNTVVQENLVGAKHNGQYNHNGSITYNAPSRFHFRVLIDAGTYGIVDVQTINDLVKLILEWKNERSWLYGLAFGYPLKERVIMQDESAWLLDEETGEPLLTEDGDIIYAEPNLLKLTIHLKLQDGFSNTHNGQHLHDGSIRYNADYGENLQVQQV